MTSKLIAEIRNSAGYLILNVPDRRNALSYDMWAGIPPIIERLAADPKVRVVVLTGQGTGAFSAGADISEFDQNRATGESGQSYERVTEDAFDSLYRCAKPVVAAIRGICFGGGFALALACDLRVASDDARFCSQFIKVGIGGCDIGISYTLPRLVGASRAHDLILTARVIDAAEAERIGLVNRVVPPEELETTAEALAREIAGRAPLPVRHVKALVDRAGSEPLEAVMAGERDAQVECLGSDDHKEAVAAFVERREPRFTGR